MSYASVDDTMNVLEVDNGNKPDNMKKLEKQINPDVKILSWKIDVKTFSFDKASLGH